MSLAADPFRVSAASADVPDLDFRLLFTAGRVPLYSEFFTIGSAPGSLGFAHFYPTYPMCVAYDANGHGPNYWDQAFLPGSTWIHAIDYWKVKVGTTSMTWDYADTSGNLNRYPPFHFFIIGAGI